ncbi:hypothetical protein DSUL_50254 [Desulfovibrionales bacterium]
MAISSVQNFFDFEDAVGNSIGILGCFLS